VYHLATWGLEAASGAAAMALKTLTSACEGVYLQRKNNMKSALRRLYCYPIAMKAEEAPGVAVR